MSDVEWTVLNMACMALRVRIQRYTKFSETLRRMRRKFKTYFIICTKYNEKKICVIQIYKSIFRIKNGLNSTHFCKQAHEILFRYITAYD